MEELNCTPAEPEVKKELSFGEKLVGITFNPSNDDKVFKLKSLFAEAANIVKEDFEKPETSNTETDKLLLKGTLYNHTIGEILNAQMNCVKLVTLKY